MTRPSTTNAAQRPRPGARRWPGELSMAAFLSGVLDSVGARLPDELRTMHRRQQGSLIKLYADDPAIHYELWLHRNRARGELGLHFETRDSDRNRRLLEYVAEDLLFLKEVLGNGLEAEPWDKGWTRLYTSLPLQRLDLAEQSRFAEALSTFIETLEPIRREAAAVEHRDTVAGSPKIRRPAAQPD
jgi:hypothetical protein